MCTPRPRHILPTLLLAAISALPACVSRIPASPDRALAHPSALPSDTWPPRDQAWADAAAAEPPHDIDWFTRDADGALTDGMAELGLDHVGLMLLFGDGRIESSSRAGVGLVRDIRFGRPDRVPEKERENSFRHFTAFASRPPPPDDTCLIQPDAAFLRSAHARIDADAARIRAAGLTPTSIESQLEIRQGMPFHLDPPWMHTPGFIRPIEQEVPSRGIFFLILGLGGADADHRALFDELSRRGWRIVLIPTGMLEYTPAAPFKIDTDSPDPAHIATAIDTAAASIAQFFDQRLAELAYTVEGATEFLSRTHPELAGKPVVVFGYSAGALAAPAIAARLKAREAAASGAEQAGGAGASGRLAALVTVCGGSNLLAIVHDSIVMDADHLVTWSHPPTSSQRGQLDAAYLRHTRLDPAAIGPSLCNIPTLIIKARIDWAIPSSATDRLYDDLSGPRGGGGSGVNGAGGGGPEWWSYLAGHESVLERLADDRVRFADWLDAASFPP